MYVAISLKTGEHVEAISANYKATRNLLLVCPECGDPVQFKFRQIPRDTPFFAHPKEVESVKSIKACSLRVDGGQFQKASSLVPGIRHGQLVNKFQKEFCKELYQSLGPTATTLYDFIRDSKFERLDEKYHQSFIEEIQSVAPGNEILMERMFSTELTIFRGGLDDICLFLNSPYGGWVGNFLYQTAYFIACMVHQGTLNRQLGSGFFTLNDATAIFIADPIRLKKSSQYALEILPARGRRNGSIPTIASALVSFLILKWRFNDRVPNLLHVPTAPFDISEASFVSMTDLPSHPGRPRQRVARPLWMTRRNSQDGWVYWSARAIMSNGSLNECLDSKSWELQNGVATLRTTKGTVRVPGKKISWR